MCKYSLSNFPALFSYNTEFFNHVEDVRPKLRYNDARKYKNQVFPDEPISNSNTHVHKPHLLFLRVAFINV